MSDNDNGKDERTIEPCRYCGGECVEGETFTVEGGLELTEVKCMGCAYAGPDIGGHNALCELVEKGRKYDKVIKGIEDTLGAMYDKVHDERDEAVRLLRIERDVDGSFGLTIYVKRRDTFLARIDKKIGGGE